VEKKKFISRRPVLSFNEVFDQYDDCTAEDLFHAAADGELTIYIKSLQDWKAGLLCSITQAARRFEMKPLEKFSKAEKEDLIAIYPELKDVKTDDEIFAVVETSLKRSGEVDSINPNDLQEKYYLPPVSYYPNKGKYRNIYMPPIIGLRPLSPITVDWYLNKTDIGIYLKLNDNFDIADNSDEEFFIIPNIKVTIKEALKANMLVVKKADLDRQSGLSPDENLSALFEIDNFPKELKIAITAWQSVQYSDQQGVKPSELIRKWLKEKYPKTPKAIKLSGEAITRITTVANWDTTPGRPKKSDTEKP